jgi:hypothetical protein
LQPILLFGREGQTSNNRKQNTVTFRREAETSVCEGLTGLTFKGVIVPFPVASWVDSYYQSLARAGADAETGKSEALALKRSNLGRSLYRYRSLENLAKRLEELRDGYVYLSKPAAFNDPYDSALSFSWEHALKQAVEQIGPEYGIDAKSFELFKEKQDELAQQGFESLIGGLLSVFYGPGVSSDLFGFFREKLGVSCFATNPNSVVMWSHYANQHQGICVEFSGPVMLSSAKVLELLHPVQYADNFLDVFRLFWLPPIDIYQVRFDVLPILAACHKSRDWKYEEEWRLVSLDLSNDRKFSLDAFGIKPSRIILGARIDQPNRVAITELAEKISVPVVNAQLATDRFEIVF